MITSNTPAVPAPEGVPGTPLLNPEGVSGVPVSPEPHTEDEGADGPELFENEPVRAGGMGWEQQRIEEGRRADEEGTV